MLCEAWGLVGVLGERVERERWDDKSKAMAGNGGGVGLNHKEWLMIRLRSEGRIAIVTVGSTPPKPGPIYTLWVGSLSDTDNLFLVIEKWFSVGRTNMFE